MCFGSWDTVNVSLLIILAFAFEVVFDVFVRGSWYCIWIEKSVAILMWI